MQKQHPQAYVAIGAAGLLKVGFSTSVKRRVVTLRKEFKAKGDVLAQIHECDRIEAAYSVERTLITFCAERFEAHSGREWFKAGDFAQVVEEAKALTDKWRAHRYPKPMTEKERAELRQKHAARRAEEEARLEAWRSEHAKRSAAWRAKRHRAANVVAQFVSFALQVA